MVSCDTMTPAKLPEETYTSRQACEAAGIDSATLKNWVSRKPPAVLLTAAERVKFSQRSRFEFSYQRVMQIAITAELVRLGFQPRHAGILAAGYTDMAAGPLPGRPDRQPGELFPAPYLTLLAVYPGADLSDVFCMKPDGSWSQIFTGGLSRPAKTAAVVVVVNEIDRRVRASLERSARNEA